MDIPTIPCRCPHCGAEEMYAADLVGIKIPCRACDKPFHLAEVARTAAADDEESLEEIMTLPSEGLVPEAKRQWHPVTGCGVSGLFIAVTLAILIGEDSATPRVVATHDSLARWFLFVIAVGVVWCGFELQAIVALLREISAAAKRGTDDVGDIKSDVAQEMIRRAREHGEL